jgi:hypothetical protein
MDVPLYELYPPSTVDHMALPGAPMSTVVTPYWENEEKPPVDVIDATAITLALL